MERLNRRVAACAAIVLVLAACEKSPIQGRYIKGLAWLEFRNGVVVHGELGDSVRYRVEGTKIVLSDPSGSVEGQIVSPTTLRFADGNSAMADAFAGVWIAHDASGTNVMKGEEARDAAEAVVGKWRVPGESHVFDIRTDGTHTWGPRISGSYEMLQGQRIRMTLVEDGRPTGRLDCAFIVEGNVLKLTAPDGAVTTYERVG